MNKRIDFTKLGGYPLAQEDLDWMQSSYRAALAALANMAGNQVILTGMAEAGGNVTAGWISLNGELIPFAAGAIGTGEYVVTETPTSLVFNDGNSKEVLFEKIAQFSAGGPHLYSNLKRIDTLKLGLVPKGLISMWSGAIGDIPEGWTLCNGDNGTPNLSGMFIVGYNNADADYNDVGKTGGAKTVTLTVDQMPAHKHLAVSGRFLYGSAGMGNLSTATQDAVRNDGSNRTNDGLQNTGGGQPHENRPPYYTLAYIMKT
jgi:microcystin-dependent protein